MNETQAIEQHLFKQLAPQEQLLADARLLIDPALREKTEWQQNAYALVTAYSRQQLKKELEDVHRKLFSEKRFEGFRKRISRIFKSRF